MIRSDLCTERVEIRDPVNKTKLYREPAKHTIARPRRDGHEDQLPSHLVTVT